MDKHYSKDAAKVSLDKALKNSQDDMAASKLEVTQHLLDLNLNHLEIMSTGDQRKIWRLTGKEEDAFAATEEFTFRVEGILTKAELGVGDVRNMDKSKRIYLSQQVSLAGLGSDKFKDAVGNLQHVDAMFSRYDPPYKDDTKSQLLQNRYFHGSAVKALVTQGPDGEPIITASTRYFTSRNDDPDAEPTDFGPGVDPLGSLAKLTDQELVHTESNKVTYFKRMDATGDKTECYFKAVPANFRIGDIVALEGAIIAFQNAQKAVRLHINMKALTLIDDTHSKDAEESRMKAREQPSKSANKLRNKKPYEGRRGRKSVEADDQGGSGN
ncbi:hypothetical protein C8R45DRAFT_1087664 [Mycena sanguinolenta]|nr:hypothetical protein C8R45DRAFT_1087664 [Mycena sanguinolenta]